MGHRVAVWVAILVACCISGCGDEQTASPSIVGQTWELKIGGPEELMPPGSSGEFGGFRSIELISDPAFDRTLAFRDAQDEPPGSPIPPVFMRGKTEFTLPSSPATLAEVQQTGVQLVGVSYCGFVNESGKPREEDIEAVEKATALLASALREALRNAALSQDALVAARKAATERVLKGVLDELARQGVEDPLAHSWLARRLESYASRDGFPWDSVEEVTDFLPSLAWTFGDATLHATLRGCASLALFDIPEELRDQELPSAFPGRHCAGNNFPHQSLACSLDAFARKSTYGKQEATLSLQKPLEASDSVTWHLVPRVTFWDRAPF